MDTYTKIYQCNCVHVTIRTESGGGQGGTTEYKWTYCEAHKNILDQIDSLIEDAKKQKEQLLKEINSQPHESSYKF